VALVAQPTRCQLALHALGAELFVTQSSLAAQRGLSLSLLRRAALAA
jgi:hypothetical protein